MAPGAEPGSPGILRWVLAAVIAWALALLAAWSVCGREIGDTIRGVVIGARGDVRSVLAWAAVVLLLAGCGAPGRVSPSPPVPARASAAAGGGVPGHVTVHEILPRTADPRAGGPGYPSLALAGEPGAWNGKLVVFLPGTGDEPSCCQMFLTQAAVAGFHVIGLTYDNITAVASRCRNDLSCYGTVHQNVFTGAGPGRFSRVPPEDGIEHRLVTLLSYLGRVYPGEGWASFLSAGLPAYRSIVICGHSQGGAEAAFIATRRRVAGVVMLSSPPDTDNRLQPAAWLAGVPAGKTPLARYFGFVHRGDPFYDRISADWKAMGLDALGPLTPVGSPGAPPYRGSHELISVAALPPAGPTAAHNATADDSAQPLCPDGTPEYAPVWRYLLQAAAGLTLSGPTAKCGT